MRGVFMKRKLSFLLVICMLAGGVCTAFAEETTAVPIAEAAASPELGAGCSSVLLMEKETGEVLYEKEADKKVPIASVTMVMTILLVVEAIDSGRIQKTDVVTVSENAAKKGG
ncbi:MAG: D-alanyl-D-alanine carboxypeptidase, partial [Clostridia bacterium]|nr:D-alanyl-D-alanine carboxypeptidase [Clostridia bacterium]